jgi:hypothetical protein
MVDEEQPFEGKGLKTAEQALAFGGAIFERSEDFDVAIDHVMTLLTDAVVLFERQSFGSAAFLAITADLFGILAVGYRPGIAAGQLDCRLRGPAGFAILFFGRVAREERMMLETFGDSYRAYMARTGRVFLPIFLK